MSEKTKHAPCPESKLIDMLGGTNAVAKLCNVKAPSVSEWRVNGIPEARRMYLQAKKPKVFAAYQRELDAATAPKVPA